MGMEVSVIWLGIVIFFARIIDEGVGTIRTISIVNGRMITAFFLGFIEIGIWIVIVSTVIHKIEESPILTVFYVFGYSTGTIVGMYIEKKIALGNITVRLFSLLKGREITQRLRNSGFSVTLFRGEGETGPVDLLYVLCPRQKLKEVLSAAKSFEPKIQHLTEPSGAFTQR